MNSSLKPPTGEAVLHASIDAVDRFCREVFAAIGADEATADAATRAMMHGSRLGVDSHGVRLLDHYVKVMNGGRVNRTPDVRIVQSFGAVASLDADHGHGALGAYRAMDHAIELADKFGIGAVSIRNSSHFGPAGAYVMEATRRGFAALAVCNSDSFVRLHDGAMRFHGTNPISFAVPVTGDNPWLLDMATSAVPYNRVQLYRSLGVQLPEGVASEADGRDTRDPSLVEMLAPVGGEFGFKGAGLGGFAEILSAVFSGMKLSFDILPMNGADISTPRGLGAFVLALKPGAFVSEEIFQAGIKRYVEVLRSSPAREGMTVMAPGDREWRVAREREQSGVPLDPATRDAFAVLAKEHRLTPPFSL
ncbi:LDH2 family malate/lactate/ureidoglycolate dehydrogenase [Pseudorhizobium tarimense]|uniref:LDH2 family malate/lactate/ureidoglycolate dehydrogenase n=1 Tax=Pseudorhizobium tarimense TaxID=1079109 RepID=A0ABV2H2C7_9HYPH|nr:Ldh family oxidoreductase [Pseudorhizobium tarimense]MCJ8517702.1 Ldh family oxidoreductase [Pseudorhizobium tarimense]